MPDIDVSLEDQVQILQEKVSELERFVNILGTLNKYTKKIRVKRKKMASVYWGMSRAMCVETIDPWKQNRIRFYHPMLHDPDTKLSSLPFAHQVAPLGGFDDCGCNWVPPAGSVVVIFFEGGHRDAPFYLGTTWFRRRGPDGNKMIFASREWDAVYKGKRKGYLIGPGQDPNDGDQVLPPWNTESYNGYDIDDINEFTDDPEAQKKITYPNIYGFKTPEKHMIKMVDGDAKCNRRWKRLEIQSGCGNYLIFKDDHLHYGGQWAHPACNPDPGGAGVESCADVSGNNPFLTDIHGKPKEGSAGCGSNILGGQPSTSQNKTSQSGTNKFFKHQNECRPIRGPGTPQNNKLDLPQSGIQLLSIGGHTLVMDDSVEVPRGKPTWERSLEDFDFGCTDKCLAVMYLKSITGHSITLSDVEDEKKTRGEDNGIKILTACGNKIELNDHTVKDVAGPKRGIYIESTSKHTIEMVDYLNKQKSPERKEGGKPKAKAKKAYVKIASGYGMEIRMNDDNSQEETQSQWLQILHPQCAANGSDSQCNSCGSPECRGPHVLRFQGKPKGSPGMVFLRAGGHSIRQTYDMDIVIVGDKDKNPSDKFTYVSKKYITSVEEVDFRYAGQSHILFAENNILLVAGRDCENKDKEPTPCLYSVVVSKCPVTCPLTGIVHWTEKSMSDKVFASADKSDNC